RRRGRARPGGYRRRGGARERLQVRRRRKRAAPHRRGRPEPTPPSGARSGHGRSGTSAFPSTAQDGAARLRPRWRVRRHRGHRTRASRGSISSIRGLTPGFYDCMTIRAQILRLLAQEDINFLLTNRIPRRLLTRFMGWFSKIEQPVVRDISIALWRFFSDLNLSEAKQPRFRSLHDCFVRELKSEARPIDHRPEIIVSPCDAIIGACAKIAGTRVFQVKGLEYTIEELLGDRDLAEAHRNGRFVTLRLTSSMYHRFHAPHDCRLEQVTYIAGDTWNVNPIALKRVEKLFCRNERA